MFTFQSSLFCVLLMFIAGMGIPIMAAMNADLSSKLNSSSMAVVILFAVGFVVSLIYLFATQELKTLTVNSPASIGSYLGGILIVFYIASVTWVAPKIGIGNAIAMVLLGQMISMTMIDHIGLWGSMQFSLSKQRFLGLVLMALGVLLVLRRG